MFFFIGFKAKGSSESLRFQKLFGFNTYHVIEKYKLEAKW
jgi:hypothetical protein